MHYAEIALKGKNQGAFRGRLASNIRAKLKSLGVNWPVHETRGMLEIRVPAEKGGTFDQVVAGLQQVFGIAWLSTARRLPRQNFQPDSPETKELHRLLLEVAESQFAPEKTFVVRVNRADKTLPFTSVELEKELGAFLITQSKWRKVNLRQPDVTFHLDLRPKSAYLFSNRMPGPGGLPVGSAGKVLVLLSGGIDSPVAAWLMAKRACRVDFIHFTASPMSMEEAQSYKVARMAERLCDYTIASRLFLVPYVHFDLALMREKVDYELILFRRFMARVAERLAHRIKAQAIVSGDNLSQVASQTLSNLASTSRAVEMPIFRPLIGFDKEEITTLAERIGTYQDSIEPYKDCCAIIARHPKTRSRHEKLANLEARIFPDYSKLIDQTLADAICLELPRKEESCK